MYVSPVKGKSKKVHPITSQTKKKVKDAVESLLQEKHSYDSMQYWFISSILGEAEKSKLSKTKQAEEILLIHKPRIYQLIDLVKNMKPAEVNQ